MKVIYTLLTLGLSIGAIAQDAFHRIYRFNAVDSIHVVTDGIQLADGGYATLGRDLATDTTAYAPIVTRYTTKGDIVYSHKVFLDDSMQILNTSDIIQMSDNNLLISAGLNENNNAHAIVALDQSTAEPLWSRRLAEDFVNFCKLNNYPEDRVLASSSNFDQGNDMWLNMINVDDGSDLWAKEYMAQDALGLEMTTSLFDTHVSEIDSSIFTTGAAGNATFIGYHLTKMDDEGEVVWSQSYSTNPPLLQFQPNDIVEMPDSSIYISGLAFFFDGASLVLTNYLSKHDSLGNLEWTKGLTQPSDFSVGTGLSRLGDNLVVSVISVEDLFTPGAPIVPVLVEVDTSGAVVRAEGFPVTSAQFAIFGSLVPTMDGGLAYMGTYSNLDGTVADLIKVPSTLETDCSTDTTARYEDIAMISAPLTWTSSDYMNADTLETDVSPVTYYNVPVISPQAEEWCPNEPIVDTLDATPSPYPTDGVVTYEWSGPGVDGATDSLVVAMEEGEYMVTVTINDDHCYMLCDTLSVSRLALPEVTIGQDDSPFCEDGTINLLAQATINSSGLQSLVWSTGEITPTINVDTEGIYQVTVTDGCGDSAVAEIDATFPQLSVTSLTIVPQFGNDCESPTATLIAQTGVPFDLVDFEWSTGEITPTINVDAEGTYQVTVTDQCGNMTEAEIDLTFPEIVFEELSIIVEPNEDCEDFLATLTAQTDAPIDLVDLLWSTGSTEIAIEVADAGTYEVTGTFCGIELSTSVQITNELAWPSVFFPQGEETENRTFGPFNPCNITPDQYELKIFNRWGQEVFASDNISTEWDGSYNGARGQTAVYVWYATYAINGVSKTDKGDVTLLR